MADSTLAVLARRDFASDPMVRALEQALREVAESGGQIDTAIGLQLGAGTGQNNLFALVPSLTDPKGQGPSYFSEKARAGHELLAVCKERSLIAGVHGDPKQHHGRG